jgi:hypothetical protein
MDKVNERAGKRRSARRRGWRRGRASPELLLPTDDGGHVGPARRRLGLLVVTARVRYRQGGSAKKPSKSTQKVGTRPDDD